MSNFWYITVGKFTCMDNFLPAPPTIIRVFHEKINKISAIFSDLCMILNDLRMILSDLCMILDAPQMNLINLCVFY